jgi:cyclohexadienyl dehydratase
VLPFAWPSAALADDLSALRTRGALRFGTSGDYAPFSVADPQGFSGLDIELGKRLAKDFGAKLEFVRFAWPELIAGLEGAKYDLALSGITVRGDRALSGRFSRPYAVTAAVALVRAADRGRFADYAALNRADVRLVVNAGGYLESVARRLFPQATITTTTDNTQLFAPVLAKTADAAISDSAEAHAHRAAGLSSLGPMTHDRKAVLIADGSPELASWVDTWLRERERDGFLPKLRQRYLGAPARDALPAVVEAVWSAIQLRCELMPYVGAYKLAHGLPVEDSAQEARVLARMADAARASGLDPETIQRLYRALMAGAKDIEQARGREPSRQKPSLDELRLVIRAVDAQLLAELRESLLGHAHLDWRKSSERALDVSGLDSARKAEIGDALSAVRASK